MDSPWCAPASGHALAALATQTGYTPRPLRKGESLLVSVEGGAGALWSFGDDGVTDVDVVPLVGTARDAWAQVRRVVYRDFAGWRVPAVTRVPPLFARHLAPMGARAPRELDGRSYGGALLLSMVSLGLGQAMPEDVVALAEVKPNGSLAVVDGLAEKLDVLAAWAPRVKRVFVAEKQEVPAREAQPFDIVRLKNVGELVDAVFGAWTPVDVERESLRLFRLTMRPQRPLVSWSGVREAIGVLRRSDRIPDGARWRMDFVEAVAARHEGQVSGVTPFPPLPDSQVMPLVLKERYQAHRVQQLLDTGEPDHGLIDTLVAELRPPWACSVTQLELSGALGRALARRREHARAEKLLQGVVETWLELGMPMDAGRPLTEWIRTLGIQGKSGPQASVALEVAAPIAEHLLAEFEAAERWFDVGMTCLAMGRAWTQLGRPSDAEYWWKSCSWQDVPPWVNASRRRWQARGRDAQEARAVLDAAVKEFGEIREARDLVALCRLDLAKLEGRDGREELEAFLKTDGGSETRWLLADAGTIDEQVRRLSHESPY